MMTTTGPQRRSLVKVIVILLCSWPLHAQSPAEFAGGTGTPDDPYLIATAPQLLAIGSDEEHLSKHYRLIADIDLDPTLPDAKIITQSPIAPYPNRHRSRQENYEFSGSFKGDNHVIYNLTMDGAHGFFGQIGATGHIEDLILVDCHAQNAYEVGMLAGVNRGIVNNCHAQGNLTGWSTLGGLVGINEGHLLNCGTSVDINSRSDTLGGLVGVNSSGTVKGCSAEGAVIGTSNSGQCGGLIGYNTGHVMHSFASGMVLGDRSIGQLIGESGYNSKIDQCYATGFVISLASSASPFIGELSYGVEISRCFFLNHSDTNTTDVPGVTGLSAEQMQRADSFVGWDFWGDLRDGVAEIWFMPDGAVHPELSSHHGYQPSVPPGAGTTADPYLLSQVEQFGYCFYHPNDCYRLAADIDFNGITFSQSVVPELNGQLNGAGFCIRNLTISSGSPAGFFYRINRSASVSNLTIDKATITNSADTANGAILAVFNQGLIKRCRTSGSVTGHSRLGGLVGHNLGVLWQCESQAHLTGFNEIGGLVGLNGGTIASCFSSGVVMGLEDSYSLGGLIGYNCDGLVVDSYAHGDLHGWNELGGLIGTHVGTAKHCYTTVNVFLDQNDEPNQAPLYGGLVGNNNDGIAQDCSYLALPNPNAALMSDELGIPLSESQMQDPRNFSVWDSGYRDTAHRTNTWLLSEGHFPVLRWQSEDPLHTLRVRCLGLNIEAVKQLIEAEGYTIRSISSDYHPDLPVDAVIDMKATDRPFKLDLTLSLGAYNWESNPGQGTEETPYEVSRAAHFVALSRSPELWNQAFVLVRDIDLKGCPFWQAPLANNSLDPYSKNSFEGSFDGRGYTLHGLTVLSANDYSGFCGVVGSQGYIRNLQLNEARIAGCNGIHRCPLPSNSSPWGGGPRNPYYVAGGLAGENHGTIENCRVTGQVTGTGTTGGLVGDNQGTIQACFTQGQVCGRWQTGGLIGKNNGRVQSAYSNSSVTGFEIVGGLMGINNETGHIAMCYAAGFCDGFGSIGGLIGRNVGHVTLSHWDTETSSLARSAGGTGHPTFKMYSSATYLGWGGREWTIRHGYDYPRLAWEGATGETLNTIPPRSYTGSGDPNTPFLLANARDLANLARRPEDWDSHFFLTNNIDMQGITDYVPPDLFTGTIDGKGYTIENLTLNAAMSPAGLIGRLENGCIQNLNLNNIQITIAGDRVGTLIGHCENSTIQNCRIRADLTAHLNQARDIGGMIGFAKKTTLRRCLVQGQITLGDGHHNIGGLIGKIESGLIDQCAFEGSISGRDDNEYIGGLAGSGSCTIKYAYTQGSIKGGHNNASIAGLNPGSGAINFSYSAMSIDFGTPSEYISPLGGGWRAIESSYWDKDRCSLTQNDGKGLKTSDMQNIAPFLNYKWDFYMEKANGTEDIWFMPLEGGYPQLSCFVDLPTPLVLPGRGTETDPYLVANVDDLLKIQYLDWHAHYRLTDDLDFKGTTYERSPISAFYGTFNGQNHTIRHLHLKGNRYQGLFGMLGDTAHVSHLHLMEIRISPQPEQVYLGALAGLSRGSITDCTVQAQIHIGDHCHYAGLVTGYCSGRIQRCIASGTVQTGHHCWQIGGFAGINSSHAQQCQVDDTDIIVGNKCNNVGGFAGNNRALIYACSTSGRLTAGYDCTSLGGLVGIDYGSSIRHNAVTLSITTGHDCNEVGGLIGLQDRYPSDVSHCYTTGPLVIGPNTLNVDGIVGRRRFAGTDYGDNDIYGCLWNLESMDCPDSNDGVGVTSVQMKDKQTYLSLGWDFVEERANGTADLWSMTEGSDYPRIVLLDENYQRPQLVGQGTEEAPYEIRNAGDLGAMRHYEGKGVYCLSQDIHLDSICWSESPIQRFQGSFDGRYHSITGLTVKGTTPSALFESVFDGASVTKLNITDANVTNGAILAGINYGSIHQCKVTGTVTGQGDLAGLVVSNRKTIRECQAHVHVFGSGIVGGLAAFNSSGQIRKCQATGDVMGTGWTGGLAGSNRGHIYSSRATGRVSSSSTAGGLVGYHWSGSIKNSYARGDVDGTRFAGGLVGCFSMFSFEDCRYCYATGTVTGDGHSGGLVGDYDHQHRDDELPKSFWDRESTGLKFSAGGTGRTTEQMQQADTYTRSGWDFEDTWMICEAQDYPRLQWEGIICEEP